MTPFNHSPSNLFSHETPSPPSGWTLGGEARLLMPRGLEIDPRQRVNDEGGGMRGSERRVVPIVGGGGGWGGLVWMGCWAGRVRA